MKIAFGAIVFWMATIAVAASHVLATSGVQPAYNASSMPRAILRSSLPQSLVSSRPDFPKHSVAMQRSVAAGASSQRALVNQYCVACHNERLKTSGLALDAVNIGEVGEDPEIWESVVRKLRGGLMPPVGRPRPDQATYEGFASWLETELDRVAATRPNPGRKGTFHRLNRTEYQNVVRDLLAVEVDVTQLLPADDVGYGFDNNAGVLRVNDVLMEQYLSAARKISREAVGTPVLSPTIRTFRVKDTVRQDLHQEGLPFGTRGGTLVRYNVPQDAEYVIKVDLHRVSRYPDTHELEVTVDGERVQLFTLKQSVAGGQYAEERAQDFEIRLRLKAGPREIGAAFLKLPAVTEVEASRARFARPYYPGSQAGLAPFLAVHYPAVFAVVISGPYNASGPGNTPSRRRIFECQPLAAAGEMACAKRILSSLARRAYRRPVTDTDLQGLIPFYQARRAEGADFESGIQLAIQRLLVSPEFLLRGEAEPAAVASPMRPIATQARSNFAVTDLELASRLSFFLWSSIPDDALLEVASQGRLRQPAVLEQQVRRMLADPRSDALVSNFIGQWLHLRNIQAVWPSVHIYPNFDDTLREGFQRETQLFFGSVLRENRSVLELLRADYTFVDERLGQHYGIPNVKGSHFRRVTFGADNPRRGLGLLGHGSVLTLTSRPNRTSPVIRGKFILDNLLGTPPPPPPANVPVLPEPEGIFGGNQFVAQATMRERMAQHRANPVCAGCHQTMDPLGFALENFDGVGQWRDLDEAYKPIDTSGVLPSGTPFGDARELLSALTSRPNQFAGTVTERLLTYALGRGLEYYDMPTVRRIVRGAAAHDYSLAALVVGIAQSDPFTLKRAATSDERVARSGAIAPVAEAANAKVVKGRRHR